MLLAGDFSILDKYAAEIKQGYSKLLAKYNGNSPKISKFLLIYQ